MMYRDENGCVVLWCGPVPDDVLRDAVKMNFRDGFIEQTGIVGISNGIGFYPWHEKVNALPPGMRMSELGAKLMIVFTKPEAAQAVIDLLTAARDYLAAESDQTKKEEPKP